MQRMMKDVTVLALGAIALLYIANPTAGWIELIPDTLPFVGNLDEAGAVVILVGVLGYYGIDISRIFQRRGNARETIVMPTPENRTEEQV